MADIVRNARQLGHVMGERMAGKNTIQYTYTRTEEKQIVCVRKRGERERGGEIAPTPTATFHEKSVAVSRCCVLLIRVNKKGTYRSPRVGRNQLYLTQAKGLRLRS